MTCTHIVGGARGAPGFGGPADAKRDDDLFLVAEMTHAVNRAKARGRLLRTAVDRGPLGAGTRS
jgi:hypothetical protein